MANLRFCPKCQCLTSQEKIGEFFHCLGYGADRGCGVLIPPDYSSNQKAKLTTAAEQGFTEVEKQEYIFMGEQLTPAEEKFFTELYESSMEQLLVRVRAGNDRLMAHYAEINQEGNIETWNKMVDNLHLAVDRLNQICDFLVFKGYKDCLYVENGKKVRTCLNEPRKDWIVCWACPSEKKYWVDELFGTQEPEFIPPRRGGKTITFLKGLGDGTGKTSGAN